MMDPDKAIRFPLNEEERLKELRSHAILDTAPEAAFERITLMATRISACPSRSSA